MMHQKGSAMPPRAVFLNISVRFNSGHLFVFLCLYWYFCLSENGQFNQYSIMETRIAVLVCTLAALSFASPCFAQADDEGDVIDIGYIDPGQSQNRSGFIIPLYAVYQSVQSQVCITYSENIGTLDILLRNMTTGTETSLQSNSAAGIEQIPVSFGSGVYYLELVLPSGMILYGFFLVP